MYHRRKEDCPSEALLDSSASCFLMGTSLSKSAMDCLIIHWDCVLKAPRVIADLSISPCNYDKSFCLVYLRLLSDRLAFMSVTSSWGKKKTDSLTKPVLFMNLKTCLLKSTPASVFVCSVRNTLSAIYFQSVCAITFKTDFLHVVGRSTFSRWLSSNSFSRPYQFAIQLNVI